MPRVTVGVPIYNAADYIEECLTCLIEQTYSDFEVLIYDNASTDNTGEICERFAHRHPRVRYVRQPVNKGATQNFIDVLHASNAMYFAWRAHDDLCASNFLEVTMRAFIARPVTKLSVGRVEKVKQARSVRRVVNVPSLNSGYEPLRLSRALNKSEASWFYGLWHRQSLISDFEAAWGLFPHGWGSDHLTLLRALVENKVVGSNETTFIQRFLVRGEADRDTLQRRVVSAVEMRQLKHQFTEACHSLLSDLELTSVQRVTLSALIPAYASKRIHSEFSIAKAWLREMMLPPVTQSK